MCGKLKRVHGRAAYVINDPKGSTGRVCHLTSKQSGPGSSYSAIDMGDEWLTQKALIPDKARPGRWYPWMDVLLTLCSLTQDSMSFVYPILVYAQSPYGIELVSHEHLTNYMFHDATDDVPPGFGILHTRLCTCCLSTHSCQPHGECCSCPVRCDLLLTLFLLWCPSTIEALYIERRLGCTKHVTVRLWW